MQATSDKTGSVGFTQTGGSVNARGIANNLTNGKAGYQPYYQWGHKETFRSNQYTTAPAANSTLVYSTESVTIGKTIQTPTTHYQNSNDPYKPIYYNAWNATYTTYSSTASNIDAFNKVVKTVYDPCPIGYTVSPTNTFYGFTKNDFPEDGSGRKYTINGKTLYIPYCGARNGASGALDSSHNSQCLYWFSNACSSTRSWFIRFNSGQLENTASGGRSWGLAVRPVREK